MLPVATIRMVTPSTFILNLSPKKIGLRMPVKTIVKQLVLLIRMMFPNVSATERL